MRSERCGGIYHTRGVKKTVTVRCPSHIFPISPLKFNHLTAIFFAGIVLAQGHQRHAIKPTTEGK
jgi:hypothetical protein